MRSNTLFMFLSGALTLGIANAVAMPEDGAHATVKGTYKVKDTPDGGVWSNVQQRDAAYDEAAALAERGLHKRGPTGPMYKVADTPQGGVWSNEPPEVHEKAKREYEEDLARRALEELEEAKAKRALEELEEAKEQEKRDEEAAALAERGLEQRGPAGTMYKIADTPEGGVWSNVPLEVHERAKREYEEELAKRELEEEEAKED
ncbi:hypothetical protein F5B20DRAFT_566961 [Whalleya microplaca]|nr:hypothetical protein F5B20DRAFT_566961 [Whalleya microplaca]